MSAANEWSHLKLDWLGTADYDASLKKQEDAAKSARAGGEAVIFACEHPTVITLGKRGQALSDILVSLEVLRKENVKILEPTVGGRQPFITRGSWYCIPFCR